MSTTEQIGAKLKEPNLSEPLSWEAICERHPDAWVCLVEMDWIDPHNQIFRTARVIGYGKEPGEPFEQAEPWMDHYREVAHYFTGGLDLEADPEPSCSSFEPWTYQQP